MKYFRNFLISLFVITSAAQAHNGNRVDIEADVSEVKAGAVRYSFLLIDEKLRKPIADTGLEIVHEKKLHMLVFDAGLKEFVHVHPEFKDGTWSVDFELPVSGNYKVWMQGSLLGGEEFTTGVDLKVTGDVPAHPVPARLDPVTQGADGNSAIKLVFRTLRAKKMVMMDLIFSRNDGSQSEVTPFLGAIAHVVATPLDGKSLIHVHPMDGHHPGTGMIHATFPKAGDYRLWVQYIDGGKMRVVPLSVRVVD